MPYLLPWAVSIQFSWSDVGPWFLNHAWLVVGSVGQLVFTARFVVQWLASERKKDSVMPVAFWWISLIGGAITFVYAIHLQSAPFMVGQGMGLFVYVRNLMLVRKKKRREERRKVKTQEGPMTTHHHRPHHGPKRERAIGADGTLDV